MIGEQAWTDGWWDSGDGLRLHYRDYPGDPDRSPVLCIPGLTRNARDFERVAARLSPARRVIVVELRGRGLSEWSADFESYNPRIYSDDVRALLDRLMLSRAVVFGTSLGGIVAMLLGAVGHRRLAGVLLNDVGPIVEERGLARIRTYVGQEPRYRDWEAAAVALAATHGHAYPDRTPDEWIRMARQLHVEREGAIMPDYDPAIAILANMPTTVPPEPWRLVDGFRAIPGLLIRGDLSDILSREVALETVSRLPGMELLALPGIGHPPTLEEPAAEEAIDRLLARADAAAG